LTEHRPSFNFAEVRFLDRDRVLRSLRDAVVAAKARYPEIAHVWLFGSLVEGNWTADSDADLMVVVRRTFDDLFDRAPYQIHTGEIPTDSLVYSEEEFERMSKDAFSFIAQSLAKAIEL
jgi:predicted nucleotidyltransferase